MATVSPERATAPVWIWQEATGVRWWTPAETFRLEISSPLPPDCRFPFQGIIGNRHQLALRQVLVDALAEPLCQLLERYRQVRLHLADSLPDLWQHVPFEWLHHDGQPLHGRLSVLRCQPLPLQPRAPIDPSRPIAVCNLLPPSEPIQPADAASGAGIRILDGTAAVRLFLECTDPTALAALILIAHGSERADTAPFLTADGSPWSLPIERGLPPCVLLLACGTCDGNLIDHGRQLLEAGAASVIVAFGQPGQEEAKRFLAGFLPAWRTGERLDNLLLREQTDPLGPRRFCILGRGDLRLSDTVRLEECPDTTLAENIESGDPDALATLLERLTLTCFQSDAPLDSAEQQLRTLLRVDWYDEQAEHELLERLDRVQETLPPLTRAWVVPLLALLSDAYDQRLSPRYEAARNALDLSGQAFPPGIFHYWSRLNYRQGRYALALQDLSRGFQQLDSRESDTRGAGLIGQLIGLLIDLDLPEPAAYLTRRQEDRFARQPTEQGRWEAHKLLDRSARIALRQGNPARALALYRLKRQQAALFEGDGKRELAWLLYIGSWTHDPDTRQWVAEVAHALDGLTERTQDIGFGNCDEIYLLRAYALWTWQSAEPSAWKRIRNFIDFLTQRLFSGDAGPPGFALCFLHLAARQQRLPDLPDWEGIAAVLEQQRYFLELSALEALYGRQDEATRLLERFQSQRQLPAGTTFPDWLAAGTLSNWKELTRQREDHERRILTTNSPRTTTLVREGLLPL